MKTILILSCSWGAGEWGQDEVTEYGILHPGLTTYLSQGGYEVWNLSQPAGDLSKLVDIFKNTVQCNPHKDFLPVLLQTDISRSFPFKSFDKTPDQSLDQFLDQCYLEIYRDFNEHAKALDMNIHVAGGLTDVTADISCFSNLRLVCPSWIGLVDSSISPTRIIEIDGINYFNWKYPEHKDEILKLMDTADARWKFFDRHPELFYPDGMHPNRSMHRILSDYLLSYFKNP